jgi:hypothetical protein
MGIYTNTKWEIYENQIKMLYYISGQHKFPFSIDLPVNIPSSFQGKEILFNKSRLM